MREGATPAPGTFLLFVTANQVVEAKQGEKCNGRVPCIKVLSRIVLITKNGFKYYINGLDLTSIAF